MSETKNRPAHTDQIKDALPIKEALLRLRQVCLMTGLSRSHVYGLLRSARFPEPIRMGKRCTRWRLSDVELWISNAGEEH